MCISTQNIIFIYFVVTCTSPQEKDSFRFYSKLQEFLFFRESYIRVKHNKIFLFVKNSGCKTFLDWELLQAVLLLWPNSLCNTTQCLLLFTLIWTSTKINWLGPSMGANSKQTGLNEYVPYKWVRFLPLSLVWQGNKQHNL